MEGRGNFPLLSGEVRAGGWGALSSTLDTGIQKVQRELSKELGPALKSGRAQGWCWTPTPMEKPGWSCSSSRWRTDSRCGNSAPQRRSKSTLPVCLGGSRRAARSGSSQGDPPQEVSLQGTADSSRKWLAGSHQKQVQGWSQKTSAESGIILLSKLLKKNSHSTVRNPSNPHEGTLSI